jgi:hypothetical protein
MSGVHLFQLRSWLLELSDDLRQLGRLVPTLSPAPPVAEDRDLAMPGGRNQLPATEEATRI